MLIKPRRGLARAATDDSLMELLLACHERIRRFTAIAVALTDDGAATRAPAEIADGADAVRRYLALALPLHVADENESLLPRMVAHAPATTAALERMRDEHAQHERLIRDVADRCAAIAAAPAELATLGPALRAPALELQAALALHLEEEERDIFPAIPSLPGEVQSTIVAELRARRT